MLVTYVLIFICVLANNLVTTKNDNCNYGLTLKDLPGKLCWTILNDNSDMVSWIDIRPSKTVDQGPHRSNAVVSNLPQEATF